jgi:hypothetical protein
MHLVEQSTLLVYIAVEASSDYVPEKRKENCFTSHSLEYEICEWGNLLLCRGQNEQ